MEIRTNKIAPLALTVALAFGIGACENTGEGVQEDTEDAEQEIEEGTDELEEETDEEATDE